VNFTSIQLRESVECISGSVRTAVEAGLALLPATHGLLKVAPDPWFDAHLTRRVARAHLEAVETADKCWAVDRSIANSGIHLRVPAGRVRLVRGSIDRVPGPGPSLRRKRDWRQSAFVQPDLWSGPEEMTDMNLLMLWRSHAGQVELAVAVPNGDWKFGGTARLLGFAPIDDAFDNIDSEFVADDDDGLDLVARIDPADDDAAQDDVG
jgi:hypothetical protein